MYDPFSVYATYVGVGEFINGVPARDLTREEWDLLTEEQQATCRSTRLYEFNTMPAVRYVVEQTHPREPAAPRTED